MITVNGISIGEEAVADETVRMARALPDVPEHEHERERTARIWAIENLIEMALVRHAAADFSRKTLHDVSDTDIVAFRASLLSDLSPVTTQAMRKAYETDHPSCFSPLRVHAAHIVRHVEPDGDAKMAFQEMRVVHARLLNGEGFEVVAIQSSDCPERGGDLGVIEAGMMVPEFEAALFALRQGQISEPFRTVFGVHVAIARRVFDPVKRLFAMCENEMRAALVSEQAEERLQMWLKQQRIAATITGDV